MPPEVEKVLRAVLRAIRAITDTHNRDDATGWIGKFFKLDRAMSDEFYRRLVPSLSPGGIAVERGLSDKPVDPDTVVDFSIAKQLRF